MVSAARLLQVTCLFIARSLQSVTLLILLAFIVCSTVGGRNLQIRLKRLLIAVSFVSFLLTNKLIEQANAVQRPLHRARPNRLPAFEACAARGFLECLQIGRTDSTRVSTGRPLQISRSCWLGQVLPCRREGGFVRGWRLVGY